MPSGSNVQQVVKMSIESTNPVSVNLESGGLKLIEFLCLLVADLKELRTHRRWIGSWLIGFALNVSVKEVSKAEGGNKRWSQKSRSGLVIALFVVFNCKKCFNQKLIR